MSATFKNAKKKLSQKELRKYMNEHKTKDIKDVNKIQSPLAKYNENGQLTCILCQSIVRSEVVWTVHINAKQHKQNVEQAKKLKERTNNFTTPLKRPLTPPLPEIPEKKIKSILKNGTTSISNTSTNRSGISALIENTMNKVSEDFFESEKTHDKRPLNKGKEEKFDQKMEISGEFMVENDNALPEGFFDDPKQDAKARNQEYKDPVEEEWEKFVKAIKEADNASNAIIAEDQEEATTERQIDEIDEQMKKLSRVMILGVTETWLKPDDPSQNYGILGCVFMRKDRLTLGGGVGFHIGRNVKFKEFKYDNPKATRNNQLDIFVSSVSLQFKNIIVIGDLNINLVLDLEKQKEEVISVTSDLKNVEIINEDDDVEIDEFDEYLDWRAKKSFK